MTINTVTLNNAGDGTPDVFILKLSNSINAEDDMPFIFPNPTSTTCIITLTLQDFNTLTLYDITGRTLLQQPFNGTAQIDISHLARGMYIAEVRDKNGVGVKGKMVKE